MAQDNIPNNQIKSRNVIEQREHEDNAAARRVVSVDKDGEFTEEGNPFPVVVEFIRDGEPQQVVEDTSTPANNRPLPVKLTGFEGDVIINSENLNLETQLDGDYDASTNTDPDNVGIIAHDRSTSTDKTKQNQRPTAIRGSDSDDDTVSSDVALHDHQGNRFSDRNPLMISENYEKAMRMILGSKWMELAVYDEIVTTVSPDRSTIVAEFKEDGNIIGKADISFPSDFSWSFSLERYVLDDDGSQLLDDDDTPLLLE